MNADFLMSQWDGRRLLERMPSPLSRREERGCGEVWAKERRPCQGGQGFPLTPALPIRWDEGETCATFLYSIPRLITTRGGIFQGWLGVEAPVPLPKSPNWLLAPIDCFREYSATVLAIVAGVLSHAVSVAFMPMQ